MKLKQMPLLTWSFMEGERGMEAASLPCLAPEHHTKLVVQWPHDSREGPLPVTERRQRRRVTQPHVFHNDAWVATVVGLEMTPR